MYATMIVLFLTWEVARWVLPTLANVLLPVVAGLGTGVAAAHLMSELRQRRMRILEGHFPKTINATENEDGTVTAVVTRVNGDVTTLLAPEGYSPAQDGGEWVLRQLLTEKEWARIEGLHRMVITSGEDE